MIDIVQKRQCTGCKMCGDLCPLGAISFQADKYGFEYPVVDHKKCISCNKCVEKCPGLNKYTNENYTKPKIYAAWLKDTDMRLYSTSGGIYFALAKSVLKSGGAVIACQFSSDWKHAEHVIAESMEDLIPTVRSKYFQSETAGIYSKAKKILDTGKQLLFCGTPCQSAALQQYLGKIPENLITMDFICRGNNSQKAYQAFIEELEEKYESPVKSVQFKNKRNGWNSLGVLIKFENGQEYYDTRKNSYWTLGYIKNNLYMRPVCHECQFRTIPRNSDFTVGDFWGIKNAKEEDLFNGISVLFINSGKAGEMLKEIQDDLHYEEHSLEEAIKGNPCILTSPKEGEMREKFFTLLESNKFTDAVAECCGRL